MFCFLMLVTLFGLVQQSASLPEPAKEEKQEKTVTDELMGEVEPPKVPEGEKIERPDEGLYCQSLLHLDGTGHSVDEVCEQCCGKYMKDWPQVHVTDWNCFCRKGTRAGAH